MNDLPVKQVGNSTIYLRDAAHVRDGFAPQMNIISSTGSAVHWCRSSRRAAILRSTSTGLATISCRTPAATFAAGSEDGANRRSIVFVRAAVQGVIREAVIAALTAS